MPVTTIATNTLGGSNGTALTAYTPPDTNVWGKLTNLLSPVLKLAGDGTVYSDGTGFCDVHGPSGKMPTSATQRTKFTWQAESSQNGNYLCAVLLNSSTGHFYVFGYITGGGAHYAMEYYPDATGGSHAFSGASVTIGTTTAPTSTDVLTIQTDGSTLTGFVNGVAAITVDLTHSDNTAFKILTDQGGIFAFLSNACSQTLGPHWGANLIVEYDSPPPLVAGTLLESGQSRLPGTAIVQAGAATGGLPFVDSGGSYYNGQLYRAATSGGSRSTVGSVRKVYAASSTLFFATAAASGNNFYTVDLTDNAGTPATVTSPEVAVITPASNATSSTSATGLVELAGIPGGTAASAGFDLLSVFCGDNFFVYHNSSVNAAITMDAGAGSAPVCKAIRFRTRSGVPYPNWTADFEFNFNGAVYEEANQSDFSDAVARLTVTAPMAGFFTSHRWFEVTVIGAVGKRYHRLRLPTGSDVSKVRFLCTAGTIAQAQPPPSDFSPGSGMGISSLTIGSRDTSPGTITYYTTDGLTDPMSGKKPDGTSGTVTTYSGAITPPSSAVTTFIARTYNALLSSPWSEPSLCIIRNPAQNLSQIPFTDILATDGYPVDIHDGHKLFLLDPADGLFKWFWYGSPAPLVNSTQSGADLSGNAGVVCATSLDGFTWTRIATNYGNILPPCPKVGGGTWLFAERKQAIFMPDGSMVGYAHCTISHSSGGSAQADNVLCISTAAGPITGWGWVSGTGLNYPTLSAQPGGIGDIGSFVDDDGTIAVQFSRVSDRAILSVKMTANGLGFTGAGSPVLGTDYTQVGSGESPLIGKDAVTGHYFSIYSKDTNYYNYINQFAVFRGTSNTLFGTFTEDASTFDIGDPYNVGGVALKYNSQPTQYRKEPNTTNGFTYEGDMWIADPSVDNTGKGGLYASRHATLPVTIATGKPTIVTNPAWAKGDVFSLITLTGIIISPGNSRIVAGVIIAFSAVVSGTGGTPDQRVSWFCSGGTIINDGSTNAGKWTPPTLPGIYTITARGTDNTTIGTTTVTVSSPLGILGRSHHRKGLSGRR